MRWLYILLLFSPYQFSWATCTSCPCCPPGTVSAVGEQNFRSEAQNLKEAMQNYSRQAYYSRRRGRSQHGRYDHEDYRHGQGRSRSTDRLERHDMQDRPDRYHRNEDRFERTERGGRYYERQEQRDWQDPPRGGGPDFEGRGPAPSQRPAGPEGGRLDNNHLQTKTRTIPPDI